MYDQVIEAVALIEQIEIRVAALYHLWSGKFADDERASFFFFKLYLEELGHAEMAAECRRLITRDRSAFVKRLREGIDETILIKIDNAAKEVQTVEEALEAAYTVETSVMENYVRSILSQVTSKSFVRSALKAMSNVEHVEKIEQYIKDLRK